MVNEVGLSNLPPSLKPFLPTIDLNVEKHRNQFYATVAGLGAHGDLNPTGLERMYETQTLWDEYMSESAANYLNQHPQSTLVVIAGRGHIKGRVSIPDRIEKRLASSERQPPFVIVPEEVDWLAEEEGGLPAVKAPLTGSDCDWAWYTQKEIGSSA